MKVDFEDPKSFKENGFVLVKKVLEDAEIEEVRAISHRLLESKDNPRQILPRDIFSNKYLRILPFKKKIVSSLKESLGLSLTYVPDFTLHSNQFGFPGWHIDSGSEVRNSYLQKEDYKFAKCGIYLQDNTLEWGGGIIVAIGGHKFPFITKSLRLNRKIKSVFNKLQIKFKKVTLDIKAGDFVYFDSRLPHTSTFPSMIEQPKVEGTFHYPNIPKDNSKLILYWDACHSDMSSDFLNNSLIRSAKTESLQEVSKDKHIELFYSDYLRMNFPSSYSDELVALTKDLEVKFACLDSNLCSSLEEEFHQKVNLHDL